MKRFLTSSAIILLTACGGSSTGPSAMVGVTLVSADPPPGSTIPAVADATFGTTAPIKMTFSIVSDKDIPDPFPDVEWVGGGAICGTTIDDDGGGWSGTLKAGEPRTLMVHHVGLVSSGPLACPWPVVTSVVRVRVQQFCLSGCTANEPTFVRELPVSYKFLAPAPR